jgi:hypothetical protein
MEPLMDNNLSIALSAAVPLHILELQAKGGPDADDFTKATAMSAVLGERGDVLLFGSKKKGEAAEIFNGLARALAVLSFVPGGVRLFGNHWETKIEKTVGKTPSTGDIGVEGDAT